MTWATSGYLDRSQATLATPHHLANAAGQVKCLRRCEPVASMPRLTGTSYVDILAQQETSQQKHLYRQLLGRRWSHNNLMHRKWLSLWGINIELVVPAGTSALACSCYTATEPRAKNIRIIMPRLLLAVGNKSWLRENLWRNTI